MVLRVLKRLRFLYMLIKRRLFRLSWQIAADSDFNVFLTENDDAVFLLCKISGLRDDWKISAKVGVEFRDGFGDKGTKHLRKRMLQQQKNSTSTSDIVFSNP